MSKLIMIVAHLCNVRAWSLSSLRRWLAYWQPTGSDGILTEGGKWEYGQHMTAEDWSPTLPAAPAAPTADSIKAAYPDASAAERKALLAEAIKAHAQAMEQYETDCRRAAESNAAAIVRSLGKGSETVTIRGKSYTLETVADKLTAYLTGRVAHKTIRTGNHRYLSLLILEALGYPLPEGMDDGTVKMVDPTAIDGLDLARRSAIGGDMTVRTDHRSKIAIALGLIRDGKAQRQNDLAPYFGGDRNQVQRYWYAAKLVADYGLAYADVEAYNKSQVEEAYKQAAAAVADAAAAQPKLPADAAPEAVAEQVKERLDAGAAKAKALLVKEHDRPRTLDRKIAAEIAARPACHPLAKEIIEAMLANDQARLEAAAIVKPKPEGTK